MTFREFRLAAEPLAECGGIGHVAEVFRCAHPLCLEHTKPPGGRNPSFSRTFHKCGAQRTVHRPDDPRKVREIVKIDRLPLTVRVHADRGRVDEDVGLGARLRRLGIRDHIRAPRRAADASDLRRPEIVREGEGCERRPAGAENQHPPPEKVNACPLEQISHSVIIGVVAEETPPAVHDRVDGADAARLGRHLVE